MINEYDTVKLKRDIPSENLKTGMQGVVVMIYNELNLPLGYEVEFMDEAGGTLALITLKEDDLSVVMRYKG